MNPNSLFIAARYGIRDVVEDSVEEGANINLRNERRETALQLAASNGHYEVALYLLRAGADCNVTNSDGWTPLFYAARDGQRELVDALVNAGAYVDLKDNNQLSPLFVAACIGHYEIVLDLVRTGADCNVTNSDGWTPLFYAARDGQRELVDALVNAGAYVDLEDNNRLSPLFVAACVGHYEIALDLVRAGANCNVTNSDGWTPLHYAARDGQIELVEALLNAGAAADKENNDGFSPLRIASTKSIESLICLVKYGAKPYTIFPPHGLIFKCSKLDKKKILIKYYLLHNSDSVDPDFSTCKKPELVLFWGLCRRQVERLKSTHLGSSTISLFKFLLENDDDKLVNYLSGDGVMKDLNEVLAADRFCVYNEMIRSQFLKGQERKSFVQSVESLVSKCRLKILPFEVRYLIYSYMSNSDLLYFRECLSSSEACVKGSEKQRALKRKISDLNS